MDIYEPSDTRPIDDLREGWDDEADPLGAIMRLPCLNPNSPCIS